MIPALKKSGLLPSGIYLTTWEEFVEKFGFNPHRLQLLEELKKGLNLLYRYGCRVVYIDGSFVTAKILPNDIDVCYDNGPMNWEAFIRQHPEFNDIRNGSRIQKLKYKSEFYAMNAFEDSILRFFQRGRNDEPKGILKIYLTGRLP